MKIQKSGFAFSLRKNRWYILYSRITKKTIGMPFFAKVCDQEQLVKYFETKIGGKITSDYYLKRVPFINGKHTITHDITFTDKEIVLLTKILSEIDKSKTMSAQSNILHRLGYKSIPEALPLLCEKFTNTI